MLQTFKENQYVNFSVGPIDTEYPFNVPNKCTLTQPMDTTLRKLAMEGTYNLLGFIKHYAMASMLTCS
jgi:hypothetical protein